MEEGLGGDSPGESRAVVSAGGAACDDVSLRTVLAVGSMPLAEAVSSGAAQLYSLNGPVSATCLHELVMHSIVADALRAVLLACGEQADSGLQVRCTKGLLALLLVPLALEMIVTHPWGRPSCMCRHQHIADTSQPNSDSPAHHLLAGCQLQC